MAVHIETAELDETGEERTADGGARTTVTNVTDGLGTRSLPATLALKLLLHFHTEPGAEVSIATEILSHTGASVFSREDSTRVPSTGKAHVAIDISVTLTDPGHYTVHCVMDGTPWSRVVSLDRA